MADMVTAFVCVCKEQIPFSNTGLQCYLSVTLANMNTVLDVMFLSSLAAFVYFHSLCFSLLLSLSYGRKIIGFGLYLQLPGNSARCPENGLSDAAVSILQLAPGSVLILPVSVTNCLLTRSF
jgi:hypothetical protein